VVNYESTRQVNLWMTLLILYANISVSKDCVAFIFWDGFNRHIHRHENRSTLVRIRGNFVII
jgi:hypothetical protein